MMKQARHDRILELLAECEELPLGEIARRLGRVSEVTVRRDVAELADMGKLVRRRGGASRIDAGGGAVEKDILVEPVPGEIEDVDAMVLPPIEGRGADTLRVLARRRKIPFLAESSPQDFGAYLGPDNFGAGRDLGNRAGRALTGVIEKASLLLVSLSQLPNTRARCEGFERGFRETFKGPVNVRLIDSRGSYRVAFERATDVFGVHGEINLVFGVNDHAILAGLDAADRLGLKVFGYSVGGEGGKVFEALAADGPLKACAALFPEIVGIKGIDVLAGALRGEALPIEVRTPHAVLTADNIEQYYKRGDAGWVLLNDAMRALMPGFVEIPARMGQGDRPLAIGFAPHYPAHDWYRGMERAMRRRCDQLGIELRVAAPQAGIAREIDVLRRQIAWRAVRMIKPGETVLVNAGPLAPYVAAELQMAHDITVVTNGLDILEQLSNHASVKVILTSGEYHSRHRCLVGPSLGALFETLRADKALLSVDGITARFGPSSGDERMALAARRFADAAREVVVLADHSLVGKDATHRISPIHKATSLITDTGSLPKDRLAFAEAGTLLTLADGTGEEAGGEGGAWGTDMQKETG